jgi:glutamate-1-semialdehyde 2,1-aminomutase
VLNARAKKLLFPHAGTFSGNPISMTAGLATMEKFDAAAVARLNALTDRARRGIERVIAETGVPACVTGMGSIFRLHMKAGTPRNYRESHPSPQENRRLKLLLTHLFDEGFILINSGSAALSTPMTEVEVDAFVDAVRTALQRVVEAG